MGIFGWIFGKATSGIIDSAGEAITKVVRVTKGDKAAVEAAIADEQLAVLAEHAAEFASRPSRTAWDSFWDGLNRAPRPLIIFWVLGILVWPFFDADGFQLYILSLELIPDEIWQLFLVLLSLYFGSRVISSDIRKPKLSPEQRKEALAEIAKREQAIIEARTPLIVEVAPTRKPPMPEVVYPTPEPVIPPTKLPDLPAKIGTTIDIDLMVESLIEREGGWSDNPADRGGPTHMGVTLATLADWRGVPTSVDDLRALKRTEVQDIFVSRYFIQPGIDTLPVSLQAHVADIGFNSGPRTAIRLLQRTLNTMGERLKTDGVIGDATRDACRKHDINKINDALVMTRLRFYNDIVTADATQSVFLKGWERRARMFVAGPGIAA